MNWDLIAAVMLFLGPGLILFFLGLGVGWLVFA